ncbi:MAG: tetratricopeptide repeat protein [Polyangiaceae bacterium]
MSEPTEEQGAVRLSSASVSTWRAAPEAGRAIALAGSVTSADSDDLRDLCVSFAGEARAQHAEHPGVLIALARMLIVVDALPEAQAALLAASQWVPDEPRVYALLGQVLLRLGDARNAVASFGQATSRGLTGPATQALADRARFFVDMQDSAGEEAVAAEVRAELCSLPPPAARTPPPPGAGRGAPPPSAGLRWSDGEGPRSPPPPGPPPPGRRRMGRDRTLAGIGPNSPEEVAQLINSYIDGREGARSVAPDSAPAVSGDGAAKLGSDEVGSRYTLIGMNHEEETGPRRPSTRPPRDPRAGGSEPPGAGVHGGQPTARRERSSAPPGPRDAQRRTRGADEVETRQRAVAMSAPRLRLPPAGRRPLGARRGGAWSRRGPNTGARRPQRPWRSRHAVRSAAACGRPADATPLNTTPHAARPTPRPARGPWRAATGRGLRRSRYRREVCWRSRDGARSPGEAATGARSAGGAATGARSAGGAATGARSPGGSSRPPPSSIGPGPSSIGPGPSSSVLARASLAPVSRPRRRFSKWLLPSVAAFVVVVSLQIGRWIESSRSSQAASRFVDQAMAALHNGSPSAVGEADTLLTRARESDPSNEDVALTTVYARALRVLDAGEIPAGLEAAVAAARGVGAAERDQAVGEQILASAANNEPRVKEILKLHDGAGDRSLTATAFYELAAGAVLEKRGDPKAVDRYQAATRADPSLYPAEVRLVRAMLLTGDANEGRRRARALPANRLDSLVLAALGARAATESAAQELNVGPVEELPRTLRSIARALELRTRTNVAGTGAAFAAAIEGADVPAVALLCGQIALESGFPEAAELAAKRALDLAPDHEPAQVLLARGALERAISRACARPAIASATRAGIELRAVLAYELGELTQFHERSPPPPRTESPLGVAVARVAGRPLTETQPAAALRANPLWGSMLLVDAALDAGDLGRAREIAAGWRDAARHPLKARREGRRLRYEGRYEEARRALDAAAATPGTLYERALLAGELRAERNAAIIALEASKMPHRQWLVAYIFARGDNADRAKVIAAPLEFPGDKAPLEHRIAAALALAELKSDKKGKDETRRLFHAWPENPDVVRAAVGFEMLPRAALAIRRR